MDLLHRYLHSVLAESEHKFKVFNSAEVSTTSFYFLSQMSQILKFGALKEKLLCFSSNSFPLGYFSLRKDYF